MEIVRFCVVTLKIEWSYSVSQIIFSVNINHMTFGLIHMMQMMMMINKIEKKSFFDVLELIRFCVVGQKYIRGVYLFFVIHKVSSTKQTKKSSYILQFIFLVW